jgi:two-component system sensor histidine kinase VicK
MADGDKFRELFSNIINNAIKYSRHGGRVTIKVEDGQPAGQLLVVKDDGIGIPGGQRDKIFRRFFRADNVGLDVEGTGLGLYIAKEIVDRHGGDIWFESEEGKGTSFFVSLKPAAGNG